jgi:hypothetical protein
MWQFAQYTSSSSSSSSAAGLFIAIYLLVLVVFIAAAWKTFVKAGQAGWKVLIPIYDAIITLRIVGLSGWYFFLYLVPVVGFLFAIYVAYKLSKAFGYGIGMTILQFLLIGALIIGFGKAKYLGPDGKGKPDDQVPANQPPIQTPAAQPPIPPAPAPPVVQ